MIYKFTLFLLNMMIFSSEILPIKSSADFRIKEVQYIKDIPINSVFAYGVETMITFDEEEQIEQIIIPDASAWSVKKLYSNILLITPLESNPDTHMTIITNKNRQYYFLLKAKKIDSYNDPEVTFNLKISYHDTNNIHIINEVPTINKKNKHLYNINYLFKGDPNLIKNIKYIFNDNKKTYIGWLDNNIIPNIAVKRTMMDSLYIPNWELSQNNQYIILDGEYKEIKISYNKSHVILSNNNI